MVKPTNGHTSDGAETGSENRAPASIRDTEWRFAMIHERARVSSLAVIGSPAEWRDRESTHPAIVAEHATIREYARVHAGAERATTIGAGTLLMAGSHVGHDAKLGRWCEVAPNAVIGGCATLGDRVRVGMGAMILPHVSIAQDVRIGAGAVVLRDIDAPGSTWVGNPAERIR